jgi:hypothetical protein
VLIPWALVGLFALWLSALIFLAPANQRNQGLQDPHRNQKASRVFVGPQVVLVLKVISIGLGAVYLLMLPFLLRSVNRYNRDTYSKAIQKWDSSFMCQGCGMIVEMKEQASAVAKTG